MRFHLLKNIIARLSSALALSALLALLCFCPMAYAEKTVVRYIDESAGFIVLDKVPGDMKDGDQVCLIVLRTAESDCEASFRWHTQQALVFPKKNSFERYEVGGEVDLKKIYFEGRGGDQNTPLALNTYRQDILKATEEAELQNRSTDELTRQKFPKGAPPPVTVEAPSIEGDEFPEIYVPKLRKLKSKKKRDTSELAMIRKGIKRSLKNRGQIAYQFVDEPKTEVIAAVAPREDYPNPLSGALKITVLMGVPVMPLASYQSVRFQTITNQTVERNTLWVPSKTQLSAGQGAGFNLQLTSRMKSFVNLGWRYHSYNSLKSRATFDEFDITLLADSRTRVSEQMINVDWGRMDYWTDWLYTSWAFGSDLAYTDLDFDSRVSRTNNDESFILASARHSFLTVAPRVLLSTGVERFGFGINLGVTVQLPLFDFKDSFRGQVTVPERVRFQGSAEDDLKKSLAQTRNTLGYELILGVSYQPQRTSR